jgi:fimbrial isopeptide formation D2 family protein/uncharacterized repeat protein (TIGR01451 family)
LSTFIRRADHAVARFQFTIRFALALAVALISVPLLSWSPASAEGEAELATTEQAAEQPAAAEEPAAEEPAEEPKAEEPAKEPAAEEPAEEPAADEPAAEEEAPSTSDSDSEGPSESTQQEESSPARVLNMMEAIAPTGVAGVCDTNVGAGKVTNFQQNTQEDASGSWINGALNANNSDYAEDDFVPQRVVITDLTPGEHELTFTYDVTKGDLYAYDFVDHLAIDEAGATIDWDAPAPVPPVSEIDPVLVHITFTLPIGTDGDVIIRFDGHIAAELDYGPDMGAGTINGAPYHISLQELNCASAGQQDNQLMAAAVDAGEITVIKDAVPDSPTDFQFEIVPGGAASSFFLDDDNDGALPNTVTFRVAPGTYNTSEINIPGGWELTGLVCDFANGNSGSTDLGSATATTTVVDDGHTTCTFTNSRAASIEVDKDWVVNGITYPEGQQPSHLQLDAQLTLTGPDGAPASNQAWGDPRMGYLQGEQVAIDESVSIGNELCEQTGSSIDTGDGTLPETVTLAGGSNHYTVTNTVTCDASLTLEKTVVNGPTSADAWTLTASGPTGALPGPAGTTGASGTISADTFYTVSESGGDDRYVQLGDWECSGAAVVSGGDTVSVPFGTSSTCTVTNATAQLTLAKAVVNDSGGDAVPGDFTLSASGGGVDLSTPGSQGGASFWVKPGVTFDLSESSVDGYTLTSIECDGQETTSVTLAALDDVTCTFTNDDDPGKLTLVKVVEDNGSGAQDDATEWTLTATPQNIAGQEPVSGAGGFSEPVSAGDYLLSEVGPAGYEPGSWTCVGGDVTGDVVSVPNGGDVTCQITNTAIKPLLTLLKAVDNGDTGATAVDTDWTLHFEGANAAGSGVEGDADVTGTALPVGGYVLSESGGPDGYSASAWDCGDHAVTGGDTIELGLGQVVICEITNTAIPGQWEVGKSADPASGSTVEPGDVITYTLTVTKTNAGVGILDQLVTDDLSDVLDDATLVGDVTASTGTAAVMGDQLHWLLDISGTHTLTYQVMVNPDAHGVTLANHVTNPECVENCITEHFTPHYLLNKSSDPVDGSTVEPGDSVTYTLTVTNDSDAVVAGAVVTDDLSDVLDNATLGTLDPSLALVDTTLFWSVPTLSPGESASVSYTVTVNADQWGEALNNVATPGDAGDCEVDCDTTHPIPSHVLTKTSDPESGSTVEPGDSVTYTLTVLNDSEATLEGLVVADDLSDVLDNATLDEATLDPTLTLAGSTLSWAVPNLNPGEFASVSYTVTVNADQWGETLNNVATPGEGGDCEGECSTTHPIPHFTLAKTSDPASGSTVEPGDPVTYTLSAVNDSDGVLTGATAVDDLSDVLDNATLDEGALDAALSFDGATQTLTWAIPELQPGQGASVSYAVVVNADQRDETLRNVVTPSDAGDCINDCETEHFTPGWTLDKDSSYDDANGDGLVDPGQTITYTLTAENTSEDAAAVILVEDDISQVLTWATIDETLLDPSLSLSGETLTWNAGVLAPGGTVSVSYVVTVDTAEENPDIWGQDLVNVATPESPGGECIPAEPDADGDAVEGDECSTTNETPPVTDIIAEKRSLEDNDLLLDGAVFELWLDVNNAGDDPAIGVCEEPADPAVNPAEDQLLDTLTTGVDGGNGQALFGDIQRGCYFVVEVQAPPGYDLPAVTTQFVAVDDDALNAPVLVLFHDLAQGQLSVVAKQQFELINGVWEPSDGIIEFGEQVRYVVQIQAIGLKTFHNVTVTDYVPGFNPDDTTSTVEASLVPGSAICAGDIICDVTVGADNLVTWNATGTRPDEIADGVVRNLEIDEVTTGEIEMIVEFPEAPDPLPVGPGETFTATLWNVGFLEYDEVVGGTPDTLPRTMAQGMSASAAALEFLHHRLTSNEVVISASITLPPGGILPPPEPGTPEPGTPPSGGEIPKGPVLPATGAGEYLLQLLLLGFLVIATGAALTLWGRRRGELRA